MTTITDENVIINLLGQIIDLDVIFASRFNNDPQYLYNAAQNLGIAPENMKNFFNQMKYNVQMRESRKESMLPQLESDLVVMFGQINPSREQIEAFGNLLVTNPNYMDNPEFYSAEQLSMVDKQFKDLVANLEKVNVETVGFNK